MTSMKKNRNNKFTQKHKELIKEREFQRKYSHNLFKIQVYDSFFISIMDNLKKQNKRNINTIVQLIICN